MWQSELHSVWHESGAEPGAVPSLLMALLWAGAPAVAFLILCFQQQVEVKIEEREVQSPVNCNILLSLILFRW